VLDRYTRRKLSRRLPKLRHPASLEDVDFQHPRHLDRQQVLSLRSCSWIQNRHNLVIIGPTRIGKSYLACAFAERACRRGHSAAYVPMPRLLHELAVARGDRSYTRLLARLAKLDLLAIDDWLHAPLRDGERRDLIEVVEGRSERAYGSSSAPRVHPAASGALVFQSSLLWPMDPAGGMENAGHRLSAPIAPAGVSHTSLDGATRRPQAPQASPANLSQRQTAYHPGRAGE